MRLSHLRVSAIPFGVPIAVFCILWSSAFAVSKVAMADCPPLLLLSARFLIAGGVMLIAVLVLKLDRLSRKDVVSFAILGIANNALYLGLSYSGMRGVSAGLAALIVSFNPVLTALLATVFLNERMTWRKALGLVLGLCGVAFIVSSRVATGGESGSGIFLIAIAVLSLVFGTILFKWINPVGNLVAGNTVQNLAAGLVLAPFAFALESFGDIHPTWHLLGSFSYLTFLCSIFALLIWFQLLTAVGATAASAYHFLMPPLGMVFGWLLLGEHVPVRDLIGVLPVALGIYLVTRPARAGKLSALTSGSGIALAR